jgi:hypothetical protein
MLTVMKGPWIACVVGLAGAAWADAPPPVASYKPASSGFVDDAFAISDDGKSVAYLTTDGASAATLHLAPLPSGAESTVEGLPSNVRALHWLGPDRVLVVSRAGDAETVTAQIYGKKGPGKEKIGPLIDVALTTVGGKPAVVGYGRNERKGVEHTLSAWNITPWKAAGKKSFKEDSEGRIPHPQGPFKILWWEAGFTRMAALKAGEFDKAKDMRRPDRFAMLDVFGGKVSGEHEIGDLLGFMQVALEHKKHGLEAVFVHLSDDHKKLLLTDGEQENEITLSRALSMYGGETIAYQLVGDKVAVSATVDPMNPPALARKKADPDDFDLHLVDRKTRAATVALSLPGTGRPCAWRIAGGHVAVLRKSKGFDRGGVALEIYKLP